MKTARLAGFVLAACLLVALACPAWTAEAAPQPWQQLYSGDEAAGPKVIGLWQFQPGQELKDSSGHKHDLTLRGQAAVVRQGPFGGALESFPAGTDNDKDQGAAAKDADELTPAGAFTLEAWFTAKPEMDKLDNVFLLDKKYINYVRDTPEANADYCLTLQRTGPNKRRMMASLGFGKDSAFITGPELDTTPGQWRHVAFTYDAEGRCRFFVDGKLMAKVVLEGRGAVANGQHPLIIGDRVGSTHSGFPGYIAQVRLCSGIVPYFTGGLNITMGRGRTAFVRMEKAAVLSVVLGNETSSPLTKGRAQVLFGASKQEITLPELAPNQEYAVPLKVDTAARPGGYLLKVVASAVAGGQNLSLTKEFPVTIVARELPNQMPVVMWGTGDLPHLKSIGFTHHLISLVDEAKVWKAGQPGDAMSADQVEQQGKMLDDLLRAGLHGAVYLYPGTWVTGDAQRKAKYNRVDRGGVERAADNVCGNFPEIKQFCYNAGASIAQTFGQYPALNMSLVHSEVRDSSDLCFHEFDKAAFRAAAGYDIPAEAVSKGGISYSRIKDFPANR
ncbi:MAG: LamG domain-containing protein, partial [Armatimonadota bacterium]